MPSWARLLVLAAAALFVLLVPSRAWAAAPLCDDRGAIMLAPPPTLDPPMASIDVGMAGDRCLGDWANLSSGYDEGSRSNPGPRPMPGEALVPLAAPGVPAPPSAFALPEEANALGRPGVRFRLERPPRA